MKELIRPSVVAAFAAFLFLFPTAGQVFDPDPAEPNAQTVAEFRASSAFVGLAPPPIGWRCVMETVWFGHVPIADFVCEPDPALVEQQEMERREWERRLVEHSERIRSRFGRQR